MLIKPDVQKFAKIKVVGLGGGGCNALNSMISLQQIQGVEFIAVNSDAQALLSNQSPTKVQIGEHLTRGLGSGGNPEIGQAAAEESTEKLQEVLAGADMVFLTAGMGGGCLTGDSLVYTNPHGPVRIDSIQPGAFVYSLDQGHLSRRKVLAAMKTGVKRIYEIKTKNQTLKASYDHPFLRVNPINPDKAGRFSEFSFEWAGAETLNPGDLVVTLRSAPEVNEASEIDLDIPLTQDLCRLFGFLLGDGWISKSEDSWKIHFSPSVYEKLNTKYLELFENVFGLKMRKSGGASWYYTNSKKVYYLLENLGLHKRASEKEIPEWVFGLPDSYKKEVILGLADADGHYLKQLKSNQQQKLELRLELSSEKMIKQLKVLATCLGLRTSNISSRVRLIKAPNSKTAKKFVTWELRINKLYQLDENLREDTRLRDGVGFLYGYRGVTEGEFFKHFGFSKVQSVKPLGEEDVYDITVDGSHNFVSEGFVTHNTGTGSIPIAAGIAKQLGALTIAVVTKPFTFEGSRRMVVAEEGIERLKDKVDALIVIPNQRLLEVVEKNMSLQDAFKLADSVLGQGVQGISDLIVLPGLINVDFADVRAIMTNAGSALMGIGQAGGENRAATAARMAIASPLLEISIEGAKGVLFNIVGGPDLGMNEVNEAAQIIAQAAEPDANIIFGATIKDDLVDMVKISVIATGFDETRERLRQYTGLGGAHMPGGGNNFSSQNNPIRSNPVPQPINQPLSSPSSNPIRSGGFINLSNLHRGQSDNSSQPQSQSQQPQDDSQNFQDDADYNEDLETPAFLRQNR